MNSERIEEAAARWFARRQGGNWTDAEQTRLTAWLEEDTAHRIAYIRLETAWNHAARMQALGAGVAPGLIPPRGSWGDQIFFKGLAPDARPPSLPPFTGPAGPNPRGRKWGRAWRRRSLWGAAASVLLAIGAAVYVYTSGPLSGDRYVTKVGAIDTVPLADGSHITLNTDSRIRVDLAREERRIELDRGEAFFQIAKDPARPFVVKVGNKRVIAVGTQFSVRRDDAGDIRVAVSEGRVRVETDSPAGSAVPVLVAGDVAQTSKTEVFIHPHAGAEVEEALSWRSGYIVLHDMTLADAVAEFNRYNKRKILIDDPALAAVRIGGTFRATNPEVFLWFLHTEFGLNAEQTEARVVLKQR
jgi:transmembrane sensor